MGRGFSCFATTGGPVAGERKGLEVSEEELMGVGCVHAEDAIKKSIHNILNHYVKGVSAESQVPELVPTYTLGDTCAVHGLLSSAILVARAFGRGLVCRLLLPVGTRVGGGVGAHGGARHVCHGDSPAHAAGRRALAQEHLGGYGDVKVEAQLFRFLKFHGARPGVGRVQQHLQLVVGGEGRAERRVVEDAEFPADVLHVDLHLLHGAVEDALGLLHRERDFFGHEVAVVERHPSPRNRKRCSKRNVTTAF